MIFKTIYKKISDIRSDARKEGENEELSTKTKFTSPKDHLNHLKFLEKQMRQAAENLEFEKAAVIRDQIENLKN